MTKRLCVGLFFFATAVTAYAQKPASEPPPTTPPAPAPSSLHWGWDLDSSPEDGLIHIDVTVSDTAENPVAELEKGNFTLLDNGVATPIQSFQALNAADSKTKSPTELILVLDQANLNDTNSIEAQRVLSAFLRQNGGHLAMPTVVYQFSTSGLRVTSQSSSDGNLLADQITKKRAMSTVWTSRTIFCNQCPPQYDFHAGTSSQQALGSIALAARRRPGRKIVIWIGYGWPVHPQFPNALYTATEFSTRIREARVALYGVNAWVDPKVVADTPYDFRKFLDGVRRQEDASEVRLSLDVLATQSGGATFTAADLKQTNGKDLLEKIDRIVFGSINHIVAENAASYRLSFSPPHTDQVDEYHELKIVLGKPGLTAHTNTGYYNQPVYYDQPRLSAQHFKVADLDAMLENSLTEPDAQLAGKLSNVELTERMSSSRLMAWKTRLPGKKTWPALVSVADTSAFLPLPPEDVVASPAPPLAEQREQLSRIIHYLGELAPLLPNLYATRTSIRYEEPLDTESESWKTARVDRSLHLAASTSVTVLYRNGSDFEEAGKANKTPKPEARQFETHGTFGAIQGTVLNDAVRGKIGWDGWEKIDQGPGKPELAAVFRYSVPQSGSHYQATHCCYPPYLGGGAVEQSPAYHGKIAFDPTTGTILRLTVQPDLSEKLPLLRSDVAVEYGPVQAGSSTVICPVRSISIMRGRTVRIISEWAESFDTYAQFETQVTDVSFYDYHRFGSTSNLLPEYELVPNSKK